MISKGSISSAPISFLTPRLTLQDGQIILSGVATANLQQAILSAQISLNGVATASLIGGLLRLGNVNLLGTATVAIEGTTQYRVMLRDPRSRLVYSAEINVWAVSDRAA